jgi:hypothetical protein
MGLHLVLREQVRNMWQYKSLSATRMFLDGWRGCTNDSNLTPLQRVAKMDLHPSKRHPRLPLAPFSNVPADAFNSESRPSRTSPTGTANSRTFASRLLCTTVEPTPPHTNPRTSQNWARSVVVTADPPKAYQHITAACLCSRPSASNTENQNGRVGDKRPAN